LKGVLYRVISRLKKRVGVDVAWRGVPPSGRLLLVAFWLTSVPRDRGSCNVGTPTSDLRRKVKIKSKNSFEMIEINAEKEFRIEF
jgi:hypothetical protein